MKVFHFFPDWDLRESVEWATDIITCQQKEQRTAMRYVPRTRFINQYALEPGQLEEARSLAAETGDQMIYVPIWSEMTRISFHGPGDNTISMEGLHRRYFQYSKMFVTDGENYEIVTVGAVYETKINISTFNRTYYNFYVMPCVPAYFAAPLQVKKRSNYYVEAKAEFITAADMRRITPSPYPQYLGFDVMTDRPLSSMAGNDRHERAVTVFDNISGDIHVTPDLEYPVSRQQASWSLDNQVAIGALRSWLDGKRGRQGAFFMPLWTRDFIMTRDIVNTDTQLFIQTGSPSDYTGPICIITTTGFVFATVLEQQSIDENESALLLDSATGVDIALADIEMVCRLPLFRSDTDKIQFKYREDYGVDVAMPVKEVTDEL